MTNLPKNTKYFIAQSLEIRTETMRRKKLVLTQKNAIAGTSPFEQVLVDMSLKAD
jgi:hypothetical protein